MSDKIQFTCPHCSHQMQLASSSVGKQGKCPSCSQVVTVSASIHSPPEAPSLPPEEGHQAEEYYIQRDGESFGPATPRQLMEYVKQGRVQPTDLVSADINGRYEKFGRRRTACPGCDRLVTREAISCPHCSQGLIPWDKTLVAWVYLATVLICAGCELFTAAGSDMPTFDNWYELLWPLCFWLWVLYVVRWNFTSYRFEDQTDKERFVGTLTQLYHLWQMCRYVIITLFN